MMQSKHKSVISTGLFLIPKEEQMLVGHRRQQRQAARAQCAYDRERIHKITSYVAN